MAICHILPEADEMFGSYLAEKEAEEAKAEVQPEVEAEHGHEGHHEEKGDHAEGEEDGHDGHDDHGHGEESAHGFPLAHTVFFLGFMAMLLLDKVLFARVEL